jgi:hypothetical protein
VSRSGARRLGVWAASNLGEQRKGLGLRERWYPLLETGDDFLETAPVRYLTVTDLPIAPDRVWAALTVDDTLVSWSRLVTAVRWTSRRPFGVGTTREVTILKFLTARERYYRWDQGQRKTFTAVEVSMPGLRRLAEDYVVEIMPGGSRFTWTIALQPHPMLTPLLRLANGINSRMIQHIAEGMPAQGV